MTATSITEHREHIRRVAAAVRADPVLSTWEGRRMGIGEKAVLAGEIVWVYARVRRDIRSRPLPEVLEGLRAGVVDLRLPAWEAPAEHVRAVRLARAVSRTLPRLPGDTRCLAQSLVLTALLARRGIGSTLLIAVSPGETFQAHAWLEHGGIPVLSANEAHFGRLVEL